MIKKLTVLGVLLAAVATAAPADAAGGSLDTGSGGFSYVAETPGGTLVMAGTCQYARYAAGVGGSGITYQIVGEGHAIGTYMGIPVVATGVRCRFYHNATVYTSGPEFLPGFFAETDREVTTNNASGGVACVTVYAVLRQNPPGDPDNLINTPEQC